MTLTIFALPKPFREHIGVIQHNAILSWTRLCPRPEIILFGDEEGTDACSRELGLRHIPHVQCNEFGTPLMNDLFAQAESIASHNLLCYLNSDIMVWSDFLKSVARISSWRERFLMVGRRQNVDLDDPEAYASPNSEERLRELVRRQNLYSSLGAMDYFVFSRGLFGAIPPFAIGRGLWDNWLVWKALTVRAPVVDASDVTFVVHQNHAQSKATVYGGEEGHRNSTLAEDHLRTMEYATHRLTPNGIKANLRQQMLRRTRGLRHALGLRRDTIGNLMSRLGLHKA